MTRLYSLVMRPGQVGRIMEARAYKYQTLCKYRSIRTSELLHTSKHPSAEPRSSERAKRTLDLPNNQTSKHPNIQASELLQTSKHPISPHRPSDLGTSEAEGLRFFRREPTRSSWVVRGGTSWGLRTSWNTTDGASRNQNPQDIRHFRPPRAPGLRSEVL